jgi:hypothetical protein
MSDMLAIQKALNNMGGDYETTFGVMGPVISVALRDKMGVAERILEFSFDTDGELGGLAARPVVGTNDED